MCGTPDMGALLEAATRIVMTASVLAGSAAVYTMKDSIVSSLTRFARSLRSRP